MTTFLQKNGMNLALTAVVTPLASYGLQRMFPVPDAGFIVIANTVAACTRQIIFALCNQYAHKLTQDYGYIDNERKYTNPIFFQLSELFSLSIHLLLPIFARYVGQRMGIQVPGYLQTIAYFNLAGSAVATSNLIKNIGLEVYQLTTATNNAPKSSRV